jgi:hypothetical protein
MGWMVKPKKKCRSNQLFSFYWRLTPQSHTTPHDHLQSPECRPSTSQLVFPFPRPRCPDPISFLCVTRWRPPQQRETSSAAVPRSLISAVQCFSIPSSTSYHTLDRTGCCGLFRWSYTQFDLSRSRFLKWWQLSVLISQDSVLLLAEFFSSNCWGSFYVAMFLYIGLNPERPVQWQQCVLLILSPTATVCLC